MGSPVKVAKLMMVKFMPVRAPRCDRSLVRLDIPAEKRLGMLPAMMPYTTVHAYSWPGVRTTIHEKMGIPAIIDVGIIIFSGPTKSAKWFEIIKER